MPPKEPQDGPRQAQDSPRRARDSPRTAQDGSKMLKNAQECTQNPLRQVPKSWLPCFAPCRHSRHARNCYKNAPANDQTNSKQPASQPASQQSDSNNSNNSNQQQPPGTDRQKTHSIQGFSGLGGGREALTINVQEHILPISIHGLPISNG